MQTQLNQTDPPVAPGKIIDTHGYKIKNFRLHKMLESAATMGIALLECDSNNASGEIAARDSRNFQLAIAQLSREWEWAKTHRDAPTGQLEMVFTIGFPTPMELQLMKNSKLKSVALELYNFFMVTLGTQAGDMQIWVGPQSTGDVDAAIGILQEIVTVLIGDGASGEIDSTGVLAPNFEFIGQLSPNIAGGTSPSLQEPSKDAQPPNVPDSPDV